VKAFVVDASVAVKWTAPEEFTTEALSLLHGAEAMHAPAHWLAEAANTLWAMFAVRRELTKVEMLRRIADLAKAPVTTTPLPELVERAAEIAAALRVTIYDALYLALAAERALPFVTADRRLVAKTQGTEHAGRTWWIGDPGWPAGAGD
jgi:predicted nucleic acid-binding protein